MGYAFTADEQVQIRNSLALCTGLSWDADRYIEIGMSGANCVPFYQCLSDIISIKIDSPANIDLDTLVQLKSAKLWLDVAVGANGGVGMHSEFIRTFTNIQGELRLGRPFSLDEMQQASNVVARNVANGLLFGDLENGLLPWQVPRIDQIASLDAKAIGESLFLAPLGESDTATRENSAWSGTIGFNLLGGASPFETWRLISAGDEGSTDLGHHGEARINTLDDFKNIIFAVEAYKEALVAGYKAAPADFSTMLLQHYLNFKSSGVNGLLQGPIAAQIQVALSSGNWTGLIKSVVAGTPIAPVVNLVDAMGVNGFFNVLVSGFTGVIEKSSEKSFISRAYDFFSKISPVISQETRVQPLSDFGSAENWVVLANSDNSDSEAMRNSLKFLSPFVLFPKGGLSGRGLDLYNAVSGRGSISREWIADRAEMLYWIQLARETESDVDAPFDEFVTPTRYYSDKATGERVLVGNGLNGELVSRVFFDEDKEEVLLVLVELIISMEWVVMTV